ncbi:FAD-dependent monooxygenase [Streptomyces johnsoniae]|uniref:FAD-dependent monooxygenase n=1 Tax=Streptomyces johnsoniae TaxID=3075532 RepID=A0ABU2SBW1_9ACTN|nr:FAD-dependent monooxygenase [Streptomyces sp. DSM 41886]MDT0446462.1 FAD-dependent monooxygenase [Streptomyces sp. DSM 41886]
MPSSDGRGTWDIRVPVLIAGGGPAGLAASLALSRYGVHHLLVNRHLGTAHTPRAHLINQRTGEILRDLGVEDRVLASAVPGEAMANHVFMSTFAGPEVARIDAYGNGQDRVGAYRAASPSPLCNLPQHLLEPILVAAIEEACVGELRFGHEFVSLEQDEHGVTAVITDRLSGHEYVVRADYLIGADGARSRVLRQLGLDLEGHTGVARAVTTWFEADLSRYAAHRPALLYMGAVPGHDPADGRVFVSLRPWHEWLHLTFPPPTQEVDENDHEAVRAGIRESIGDPSVDITIKNVSAWEVNSAVAPRYARGRVFCVGDAVHQNPPTNGLGLNSAIADSFNLCWKLRLVLDGLAGPGLLDTYEAERQPVGRQIVDRAFRSMLDLMGIPQALGFADGQSAQEQWHLLETLHDETPEAEKRRAALAAATAAIHGQANAHGVELGYRYRTGATVPDHTPEPVQDRDPELYYRATTWPGARLPHAWLENGRRRCSTLDVTGHGRFVLLTGPGGERWHEAARDAALLTGLHVTVRGIGTRGGLRDPYGTWADLREVEASGAVLVRPDGHVAWRAADSGHAGELPQVMATILATSPQHPDGEPPPPARPAP